MLAFSGQYLVNRACELIVRTQFKGAAVKFVWVPTYSGLAGNEAAHSATQKTRCQACGRQSISAIDDGQGKPLRYW